MRAARGVLGTVVGDDLGRDAHIVEVSAHGKWTRLAHVPRCRPDPQEVVTWRDQQFELAILPGEELIRRRAHRSLARGVQLHQAGCWWFDRSLDRLSIDAEPIRSRPQVGRLRMADQHVDARAAPSPVSWYAQKGSSPVISQRCNAIILTPMSTFWA